MALINKAIHVFNVILFAFVALSALVLTTKTILLLTTFVSSQDNLIDHHHDFSQIFWYNHEDSDQIESSHGESEGKNAVENWLVKLVIDLLLLTFFVIQHSLMAHDRWKSCISLLRLTVIDRSLYIICTSLVLTIVMSNWQCTFSVRLWSMNTDDSPLMWLIFTVLHVIGWTLILGSTLLMDANELIGLKQVYYYSIGLDSPLTLKSAGLRRFYSGMRHPGRCAFMLMLVIHPHMTASRALLSVIMGLYTLSRFNIDKEDHSYLQQMLASKEDELGMMISDTCQHDTMSVRRVWRKSFHYGSSSDQEEATSSASE